jgi:hypothetical protein
LFFSSILAQKDGILGMDISPLRNDGEDFMLTILVFLFLLIVLDIAAMRWGFTSSDGPESKEWERRQQRAWPQDCSVKCIGPTV